MKFFIGFSLVMAILTGVFLVEAEQTVVHTSPKINGVSLVNPHFKVDSIDMASVSQVNAGWVAVIPYAFSREGEPEVYFNTPRQWWGERLDGSRELIRLAQQNGLKVMLKPHVWLRGSWIGDFDLTSEEDWRKWEQAYMEYALANARLAQEMNVRLFCIGTEYKNAVSKRPAFWSKLIGEIRKVYQGQLTYAANWDNYKEVPFWDELDLIGVDAYFPLVHTPEPTVAQVREAWEPIRQALHRQSLRYQKPVLFAEYGYQSTNGALGNHWEVSHDPKAASMEVQSIGYEALYQTFWNEPWFAGGFLWKWHFDKGSGGEQNTRFTPQGKPASAVIARWYGQGDPANIAEN